MKWPLFATLCAVLSGCQSVGVQYVSPREGEPAALLRLDTEPTGLARFITSTSVTITNFDAKGCYSGKTAIDDRAALVADQPVVIALEKNFNDRFCRGVFSFTPKANAEYLLTAKGAADCALTLSQIEGGKKVPVAFQWRTVRVGFGCIRMTPAED